MRHAPLNLRKGDYILHIPSNTVGVITKREDPWLHVEPPHGGTVKLADFPVDYFKLTKREYETHLKR